jgi:hypothetical protein
MHVSRVAAALLRIVRRSRRPLAIALVTLVTTGIAVTGVSGAAMAAEQPAQPAASGSTGATTSSGDTGSPSTGADGASTGSSKPATSTTKPAHATVRSTTQHTTTTKAHTAAKVTPATAPRSSLVALAAPVITLSGTTAVADTNHDGRTSAGDVATTTWTVTNTGPDPVTGLSLTVSRGSATCATTTIPPTSDVTCTSKTALNQADLDAAKVSVTGTAHGTITGNPSASDPATVTRTLPVSARLSLSQSIVRISDRDHDGATSKGDYLQFVFTVKNTGTQTLHSLSIVDSKLSHAGVSIHCTTTTLAPGHSTTCRSGAYVVTSFDAKQGFVSNTARARAKTPAGTAVLSAQSTRSTGVKHEIKLRANLNLALSIASVKDNDHDGQPTAGDTVTYAFNISNTGNATASGLFVVDKKLQRLNVAVHCGGSLAAGASMRCFSGPVTISGFNVKQGKLVNFATVFGRTAATGQPVQAFDALDVSLNVPLRDLVGSTAAASLPRTGGVATTQPLTLAFWMILLGFGLVVAGRRPGRLAAPLRNDRASTAFEEIPED